MHSIQVYIDEKLDSKSLNELKTLMQGLPHVTNVEINTAQPHDMLVEYEEHYNIPMLVMDKLHHKGLHPDIVSA
jgi:cell division protein FtsX